MEANPKEVRNSRKEENEISLGKDRPIPFFRRGGGGWLERGIKGILKWSWCRNSEEKLFYANFIVVLFQRTSLPCFLASVGWMAAPEIAVSHLFFLQLLGLSLCSFLSIFLSLPFSPSLVSISSPTLSLKHLFLVPSVGERWRQIGERLVRRADRLRKGRFDLWWERLKALNLVLPIPATSKEGDTCAQALGWNKTGRWPWHCRAPGAGVSPEVIKIGKLYSQNSLVGEKLRSRTGGLRVHPSQYPKPGTSQGLWPCWTV